MKAPRDVRAWVRRSVSLSAVSIQRMPGFGSHSRDRIQTRRTTSRRNDYTVTSLLSRWNEGIAGSRARTRSSGGIPFMWTVTETRLRRAPWGRKKHLLPLPILSVVLLVTAMAAPGLLRMTVTIIEDTNLTLTAAVQNVVHPSGPDGKIVGIMRVTNHASTDILLTAASVRIQSLAPETPGQSPDGR